jgi:hypothetical protein
MQDGKVGHSTIGGNSLFYQEYISKCQGIEIRTWFICGKAVGKEDRLHISRLV